MTDPTTTQNQIAPPADTKKTSPNILSCVIGSLIAAAMATGSFFLNSSIAQYFADRPIQSQNLIVVKITIAVRTLVVGISTLGTGVFSLIALGLFALGIQVAIQHLKQPAPPNN